MTDPRVQKHADILVDYSCSIQPGDRVIIESTTLAEPLLEALIERVLIRGGHPYLVTKTPHEEAIFLKYAQGDQLTTPHIFTRMAYEQFEARIRVHALADANALKDIPDEKQSLYAQGKAPILKTQMARGKTKDLKWVTTLFPTKAYAQEAGMSLAEYENFVYGTMHADLESGDPIGHWLNVEKEQQQYIDLFEGKDKVELHGPNVDLNLSVKGRTFVNSSGRNNMPSGEIFTGPIENSVNGWVRYTYPVIYDGRVLEDVELKVCRWPRGNSDCQEE